MLKNVMNLGNLLTQVAQRHADEPGFIEYGTVWSWSAIDRRVNAICTALRERGVRKGERILVHSRNNLPLFESA